MKTLLLRIVRIIVSVGLLSLVLWKSDIGKLADTVAAAKVQWLLAAFAVNLAGNVLGAWRWQILLRSQGRILRGPFLFGSYLVGLFFNNFLPSTIGGDVVRAASAKHKGGGTLTENLTVVLVERMIGLLATFSLGGVAALTGEASRLDHRLAWALGCLLGLAVCGIYLALSSTVRRLVLRILDRIPIAFLRRTIGKMLAAFELFSQARGSLLANYAISLGFQFLLIVHFWMIQFAFGQELSILTFGVVVPVVFFVMLLPIGINGLGVRESAFVLLLGMGGMAEEPALALSLASYAIAVAAGLLGGGVHLWREVRGQKDTPDESDLAEPGAER